MSNEEIKLDIFEFIDSSMDAYINKDMLKIAENSGDELAYNIVKLLNEYGIYGRKVTEFTTKLQMLINLNDNFGGKEE